FHRTIGATCQRTELRFQIDFASFRAQLTYSQQHMAHLDSNVGTALISDLKFQRKTITKRQLELADRAERTIACGGPSVRKMPAGTPALPSTAISNFRFEISER
ncbi:MAG TPA: hypothetical protein VLW83_18605, partial [Candidatus Acidoferrales bacterium]|nr:hypothetical protein [Candidatus Acidoferrales bacterium]